MQKYLFKLLLAGSGGTGKTSLLERYTSNQFTGQTKMTIGVDFAVHQLVLPQVGDVTLQIWDFGGEQRFRTMLPGFCRGAAGTLLLYSVVQPKSFWELQDWIDIIRDNTHDIPVILVGAKCDLLDPGLPPEITDEDVKTFMEKNAIRDSILISSKTGQNVHETFEKEALLMAHK